MPIRFKGPDRIKRLTLELTIDVDLDTGIESYSSQYRVLVVDADGMPIQFPQAIGDAGPGQSVGDRQAGRGLLQRFYAQASRDLGTRELPGQGQGQGQGGQP